ncbi:putative cytochrome b5-like heme/steroid binding domain, cytochrome b5, heme-binding protein [Helianthus anomalus]
MFSFVYDVTKFLEDHPGGDGVLVPKDEVCASRKDATNDFKDVGHSTTAKSMMDEFYAGDIDASKISSKSKVKHKGSNQAHYNQDKTPEFIIKILQFLVPLFRCCGWDPVLYKSIVRSYDLGVTNLFLLSMLFKVMSCFCSI